MSSDPYGLRPGEVAIELPEDFDAGVSISSAVSTRLGSVARNARRTPASRMRCARSMSIRAMRRRSRTLRSSSHLLVLYWMDKARRDLVVQAPRHYDTQRGTFALRSPVRPNPIAASVVKLVGVGGPRLSVIGLDCLDGTPLIDIKPYFASVDAVPDAVVGWHAQRKA